jgi:hypothetical protein
LFIGNLARFMDSSDRLCSFPIISLCKAHFKGVKLPLGQSGARRASRDPN